MPIREGAIPGQLILPHGERFPKVCLKCGETKGTERHAHSLAVGSAGQVTGATGGIVGASAASAIRGVFHGDYRAQAWAILALSGAACAAGLIYWKLAAKLEADLPLCEACAEKRQSALRGRTVLIAALLSSLGSVFLGVALDFTALCWLGGIALLVAIGWGVALKIPSHLIAVPKASRLEVTVATTPEIAAKVLDRAAKRDARRTARIDGEAATRTA